MNKTRKIILGIVSVIILTAFVFFVVEYNKAKKTKDLTPEEFKTEYSKD